MGNEWFKKMWQMNEFLILDTETTGLSKTDEVVQIGIINKAGKVLFDGLIKPSVPIGQRAAEVHGISEDDVADCPTISNMYWQLHGVIEGSNVFVFNAPFDRRMLQQSLRQAEHFDLTELCTWHDVMDPYARLWNSGRGRGRWQSLTKAPSRRLR